MPNSFITSWVSSENSRRKPPTPYCNSLNGKFLFVMQFYQKFEKYQNTSWHMNFEFSGKNLGISIIEKQNSLYNSRNLYEIKKTQVLSGKFRIQLPSRILVFPEFLIKLQCKKKIDCTSYVFYAYLLLRILDHQR